MIEYIEPQKIEHSTVVYSDNPTCNSKGEDCKYEIIHAYGVDSYDFNGNKLIDSNEFSRKVVKTRQDISATPTGFGRIKLWD